MATQKKYTRNIERLLLLMVTIVLACMAVSYYFNIKEDLSEAENGYKTGKIVNLAFPVDEKALKNIFTGSGYFTDDHYINFLTKNLVQKVNAQKSLPNLGALNKKGMMIDAEAFNHTGSESGKLRFINSLAHLGMSTSLYEQEQSRTVSHPSVVPVQTIKTSVDILGSIDFDKEIKDSVSKQGILVKLTEIFPDNYWDTTSVEKPTQTEFYARTDKNGGYAFMNLKKGSNYSVLPIKPGYEFGIAKGQAAITKDKKFNFLGRTHLLRLLDNTEYRQLKNDNVLTVRTPENFINDWLISLLLFALSFWIFHVSLSIKNYRSDQFILPLIMFIAGTGITVLYAIQDPLRDEIYGSGMAKYAAAITFIFSILVFIFKKNPVNTWYHSSWFDPASKFLPGFHDLKTPRGYTWLLVSIVFMLLLVFFGTGPEGSDVKVNLFGFQVSELSKICMVIFFAGFFAANADYFRNIPDNRWLIRNNITMFVLFIFLLIIYAFLGDLGPAIVLCITFLFFYAFAKDEFFAMLLAGIAYGLLLFIVAKFTHSQTQYLPLLAGIACVGTLAYALIKKKFESVFFIVLIISSFILLGALPFDFTRRLADRNAMFSNIWDNTLVGGDQIAHGIWSLNAGGFTGQGLGNGYSNLMPAYHTDMIVQSIGEELGTIALIALFLAFGLLIYRCILAARRTGKPFMFYLAAGIAIATMLQFIIIVAGTLDLIPLTGISVPFLSKGNAGIIITLIAFLFIILMSHEKGNDLEMEYVKKHFDNVNTYAILTFFTVILIFIGSLIWYQVQSNKYIVKPALVLNRQGEWQYSYNPRISMMLRQIEAGNIYDRNGMLLATSDKNTLKNFKSKLLHSGADSAMYNEQIQSAQKRYYPYASDLLFWLGDYNKEIAREESRGYAAEYRHYTTLRGFNVTYTTVARTSDRYKENRFLPETDKESELLLYDYSSLAPFIKAGKSSTLIAQQNKKPRDIQLSIDVMLNEKINNIIQNKAEYKNFRTSVVAINPKTGDVLASASNPLPSYKDQKLIGNMDPFEYREIFKQIFGDRIVVQQDLGITFNSRPGSTAKLFDAYAAYNQYGLPATQFTYFIYPGEVIHQGEPVNENVDMRKAIVRSSNVYFIKLINEKNLQASLFNMYDALGVNILNRGGYHFHRPDDYNSDKYFKEWNRFVSKGKNIYNNKRLMGNKRRLQSNYSNLAWGQGELMATPLHLARMSGTIANAGVLQAPRFLLKSWQQPLPLEQGVKLSKYPGMDAMLSGFMKEQSASVSAATQLEVHGKTGSPERDKLVKNGERIVRKRVTDAWYTFFVMSPKYNAPLAFAIRIEEIGNSDYAKKLAVDILHELKQSGYF